MDSSLPSSEKDRGKTNEIHGRELVEGNAMGRSWRAIWPLTWGAEGSQEVSLLPTAKTLWRPSC